MKIKRFLVIGAVVSLVLAAGCENRMQRNREEARARWAESRAEMLTKFAQGAYARGELGRAREHVQEAMTMAPKYAPLYVLAARLALEKGELDTASSCVETAVKIDPKSAEAQYVLGTVEQAMGRLDRALAAFCEAARIDPAGESYVLAEAEMRVARGETAQAAERLQAAVAAMPARPAIHMAYGDVLSLAGEYEQAAGSYRIARRLDPQRPEVGERLAVALFYSGAYGEAESLLAEAAQAKKDAVPEWITRLRGDCLLALGRIAQARDQYALLMKADPESAETLLALAKCDVLEDQSAPARARLDQALARSPSHAEANALMGYLLVEADRPGEALAHLELALKDPKLPRRDTVERLLAVATRRAAPPAKPGTQAAQASVPPVAGAALSEGQREPEVH